MAFLLSAYLVLVLLLCAYGGGLLSGALLNQVDEKLFHASSRNSQSRWKRAVESMALTICDQQLAILIAGFVQAFCGDLDAYHWNFVIYLAWLSATVHLASLSFLRDRLNMDKLSCNVRLFLMLVTLVLLFVALVPTRTSLRDAVPIRCLWTLKTFDTTSRYSATGAAEPFAAANFIVTYLNLTIITAWKVGQLFDQGISRLGRLGRARLEHALESAANRALTLQSSRRRSQLRFRLIAHIYVPFVVYMEVLESFMATNIVLAVTLLWGTVQLVGPMIAAARSQDSVVKAELEMGFGQMLPLLLLLQPALAGLGVVMGKQESGS